MGKRTKPSATETTHPTVNSSRSQTGLPAAVHTDDSSSRSAAASISNSTSTTILQPPPAVALKQSKAADDGPGFGVTISSSNNTSANGGGTLSDHQQQSQHAGSSVDVSTDELEFHEAAGAFDDDDDDYDMSGSDQAQSEQRKSSQTHHSSNGNMEENNHSHGGRTSASNGVGSNAATRLAKAASTGKERSLKSSIWNAGPGALKNKSDGHGQGKHGNHSRGGPGKSSQETIQLLETRIASMEAALQVARETSHSLQDDLNAYKAEVKVLQKEKKGLQEKAIQERGKNEEHAHTLFVLKSDLRLALDNAAEARAKAESDLKRMEMHWKSEWETRHTHLVSKLAQQREAADLAKRELELSESEAYELRAQNAKLKHSIATSTRMETQTTDDTFSELMRSLGHGISNWALNFVRATKLPKIDPSKIVEADDRLISAVVPAWKSLVGSKKAGVIQGLVAGVLVEDIFNSYFFGLPTSKTQAVQEMEGYLAQISSAADLNLWRSTTLSILRRTQDPTLQSALAGASSSVHTRIISLISTLTNIQPQHPQYTSLKPLIDQTIHLSRLLRVQRAQFSILLPNNSLYNSREMEEVSGLEDDEDALDGKRNVSLVVVPGLCKFGDEMGERMEWRNLLVRAKVLCLDE